MKISVTGIGAFIDFLVLAYFSLRLWKGRGEDNRFYYLFSRFSFFFSLFYLLFSLPILFAPENGTLIAYGYVIGHFFANISFAYLASIIMTVAFPASNKEIWVFRFFILLGFVLTAVNFFFMPSPKVLESGVVEWNQQTLMGIAIILSSMVVFLPAAFHFVMAALKSEKDRARYFLIGVSFAVIIVGGPLHDIAKTASMNLIADLVTTTGFFLMFLGVRLRPKKLSPKESA